ncbi:hypothetical protein D3879_24330 [Pseudomonas cavernicola]|uniref:Uncharacterized protein n=1 Tax=Pseudomonas cavernicola TaxID=2320866 RepID=A0A418X904_9PSED|nr:DUF6691 family protein [Pseudomonas cavernicola]RJG08962.1 hypothetical protein D3879_24330 [Pseudomonas cavernicola]
MILLWLAMNTFFSWIARLEFGIGLRVSGIYPQPVKVLLGSGVLKGAVFVIAMLGGMGMLEWLECKKHRGLLAPASVGNPT